MRDVAHGGVRQVERVHESHQRSAHQCHVGGLDGHVGAGADGESDVGSGEGGGVIDAVADHRHRIALRLEFCDFVGLAFRPHAGDHMTFVDTDLACDGACGGRIVSREHDGFDATFAEQFDGLARVGFRHVGDGDDAGEMAVDGR